MDEPAIWSALTEVFREIFEDPQLTIGPGTTAKNIPDWDSLAHIQLMVSIEQTFGMRFNTGEVASLNNVGEMVALIASRTSKGTKQVAPDRLIQN
jgi:acyl carrier protein